ncbi:MAG TPA: glutamine--fructose-6-phosphate transaminase (isomerizing) [Candidatus Caccenecus avistercoris]|nr:glutamine--fructose-6-phosphate transaminase (isomerizing) [Candidatus Caccenecus avistercoris]
MCGIVGYVGKDKALPKLITGLKNLEYRGYDSAGVAILDGEKLDIVKNKGRIKNLEEILDYDKLGGNIGIAHTRWATHGIPSLENAHPHMDSKHNFAVVHNGIIENYQELKEKLIHLGYTFVSETDTEVIPMLMEYYYEIEKDVFRAFQKTTSDLKGSYAILVISPLLPNSILVAKNNSPLVIGKSEDGIFAASDIPAIISYTKDFYFLEDGESALINEDITFYDKDFKEIQKNYKTIDWEVDATSKNGYEDYMLKEIHEQPKALEESLAGIVLNNKPIQFMNLSLDKNYLKELSSIYIVACGTAMHAGLTGKYAIEKLCRIPVNVVVASEFRYQDPILDKHSLCIFISQSGETADTIAALKLARSNGAKTITVTNVFESSITREADYTIYTHAGPEIAVASTKAYTSQVGVLISLAIYIKETLSGSSSDTDLLKKELLSIPKLMEDIMEDIMKDTEAYHMLAKEMMHVHDLYYIGRGNDYHTAMEGSLKLKEISYIHSEAYPAGELKHGPIALIDNGTYVMGIITDSKTSEKTWSNLEEVKSRGAKIILVTNQNIEEDIVIRIPLVNPILAPLLAVIPLQFIAYYIAKEKGLDVDKPRNLAKSVTVE